MTGGVSQASSTGGFCAERHSAQATAFRIQKPNSSARSFAFIVHPLLVDLFSHTIQCSRANSTTQTLLYTSDEGFGEIDLLFTIQPPDFLTFVCPDSKIDDKQFASIISRVDRWMQDRFITTLICSRDDAEAGQHMASELIGDLRRISSQVVWVSDGRDLREVLTALRFFS